MDTYKIKDFTVKLADIHDLNVEMYADAFGVMLLKGFYEKEEKLKDVILKMNAHLNTANNDLQRSAGEVKI
jgi:hypothetical protein